MRKPIYNIIKQAAVTMLFATILVAQDSQIEVVKISSTEGVSLFWYLLIIVLNVALFAVVFEWMTRAVNDKGMKEDYVKVNRPKRDDSYTIKATISTTKARKNTKHKKKLIGKRRLSLRKTKKPKEEDRFEIDASGLGDETTAPLPYILIRNIWPSDHFKPLPESDDQGLLDAIELLKTGPINVEAREMVLETLAGFKTRNSVDAISAIALEDKSPALRSNALLALSDFDHESVFETMLIASADSTHEVRASAARGIFQLKFDRKDAWMRIAESYDQTRVRQCGRAMVKSDMVKLAIQRLVHRSENFANEGMAMTILLIKAGETKEIFEFHKNHPDHNVRKAITHAISLIKKPNPSNGPLPVNESQSSIGA